MSGLATVLCAVLLPPSVAKARMTLGGDKRRLCHCVCVTCNGGIAVLCFLPTLASCCGLQGHALLDMHVARSHAYAFCTS